MDLAADSRYDGMVGGSYWIGAATYEQERMSVLPSLRRVQLRTCSKQENVREKTRCRKSNVCNNHKLGTGCFGEVYLNLGYGC